MKDKSSRSIWIMISIVVIIIVIFGLFKYFSTTEITNSNQNLLMMKISSPVFENNGVIPDDYTCRGRGDVPLLEISEMPTSTVSLVLIVDDPDAPSGTFVHWVMWNIPPDARLIDGKLPAGAQEGANSLGKIGFVAPCPPSGTHHYNFQLFALDTSLILNENADKEDLIKVMDGHILKQAILVGVVRAK